MRLGHLGKKAFTVSDSTVPPLGKNDLLILASSSGETQTVYDVGVLAKTHGARVAVITGDAESRIAGISDAPLILRAQTKFGAKKGVRSIQPMATQFEQCLHILFDVLILLLMRSTNQTESDLWARHSNLD
jgi:6-phospho-3-hexuloisomerase